MIAHGPSFALEAACAVIVAQYLFASLRGAARPRDVLARAALLMVASFCAEDTVIRAYGFYGYAPEWSVFVDKVPLWILIIWPVVILSAQDLAAALGYTGRWAHALATAAIVFADAWLIEPVSVHAALWSWTEPGIFDVPPVGVLGWAIFAGLITALLPRGETLRPGRAVVIVVGSVVGTHLLLLASWWGVLRWVSGPIGDGVAIGGVVASATLAVVALARSPRPAGVPRALLLPRIPAALFFVALVALWGGERPALFAWVAAFVPPWLVLMARARGREHATL